MPYVLASGGRTQDHEAFSADPSNSSDAAAVRSPGTRGGATFVRYWDLNPSRAAGAGILPSEAQRPPRTVGHPSTQSNGSNSAGLLVKPVADSKNGWD